MAFQDQWEVVGQKSKPKVDEWEVIPNTRPVPKVEPTTSLSAPPPVRDSALKRFGSGLGESLLGIGKIITDPVSLGSDMASSIINRGIGPKDPNAPGTLETVAELVGIPIGRIKSGDYAGAIGQVLPDILMGGMAGRAAKLSKIGNIAPKPRPRLKPITTLHKGGDLATVGLESLPDNSPAGTIRLPPETRLMDALNKSEVLSKKQASIISQDRARKLAESKNITDLKPGVEGTYQQLAAMKGKSPKVKITPLEPLLADSDRVSLVQTIRDSSSLNPNTFEGVRAEVALNKLMQGSVPQSNEIELLSRVFGREFGQQVAKHRPLTSKAREIFTKAISTPKALRASMDFSFPLRQGLPYIGNKEFWKSFKPMFKSAFDETYFDVRQKALRESPLANQAHEAGLDLTDLHTNREESFVQSFAEEIPGIRTPVKASNRAYVAFGNDLRMQVFESMMKDTSKVNGVVPKDTAHKIANFINVTTGRGGLGRLEKISGDLNQALFSPRLLSSRLQMVGNPALYLNSGKAARKQALRSLISVSSFLSSAGLLAKTAGADISLDMESSDFLKIRNGDVVIDLAGGLQQPIRAMYRIIGAVREGNYFDSKSPFEPSPKNISAQFMRNKLAPIASTVTNLAAGKTTIGDDVTFGGEMKNLFMPMIMDDIYELYKEDPDLLPLGLPAVFGGSIQVYPKPKRRR